MSITRFSTGLVGDTALAGNTSFSASDFELISTIRVGATAQSTITFSNIPQEYKHLQIRGIFRSNSASVDFAKIQFNGITSTIYSAHNFRGDGSTTSSGNFSSIGNMWLDPLPGSNSIASTYGIANIDILDYSTSFKNKTIKMLTGFEANSATSYVNMYSGAMYSTTAINSISFIMNAGQFIQHSKLSLYGIRG